MHDMNDGYYRYPAIAGDRIVFVCEDDLFSVAAAGGDAMRLTVSFGTCSFPRLSPDGGWIAFISTDEGNPELYVMPARGGEPRRLTFLGASLASTIGWSAGRQRDLLRREPDHVVRGHDAALRHIARRRNPARAQLGTRALVLVRTTRAARHRAKRSRSGALEALSRWNGRRNLDRRAGQWNVHEAAAARWKPVLADVDRRSDLFLVRSRRDRQPLLVRARRQRRHASYERERVLRPLSVDRRQTHRLHRGSGDRVLRRRERYRAAHSRRSALAACRRRRGASRRRRIRSNISFRIPTERRSRSSRADRNLRCRFSMARRFATAPAAARARGLRNGCTTASVSFRLRTPAATSKSPSGPPMPRPKQNSSRAATSAASPISLRRRPPTSSRLRITVTISAWSTSTTARCGRSTRAPRIASKTSPSRRTDATSPTSGGPRTGPRSSASQRCARARRTT